MNKDIRRGVVALATVLTLVAALAGPAAASTLSGDITGGTIVQCNTTGTICDTVALNLGVETLGTNCSRNITISTNDSSTSTTTWQLLGFSSRARFQLNSAGTYYVLTLTSTGSSTVGTVTGVTSSTDTTSTLNTASFTIAYLIQTATDQTSTSTSCATTTTVCRYNTVNVSLQGSYTGGTGGGTAHAPAVSDTASLTGVGTMGNAFAGCQAPFATFNTGTLATTSTNPLVFHVTSVT